jgi:6-phosphogluconolactonase
MMNALNFKDEASWLESLTKELTQITFEAIAQRGIAHVSLSGGSTPKTVYAWWNRQSLDWNHIHWWLGDERWVSKDAESSNEKMVYETLGKGQPNFKNVFHSWHCGENATEAAGNYEKGMIHLLGTPPVFDLVLLGLGDDGHTASLFPGSAELQECSKYAISTEKEHLGTTRLTFTYPTLNSARNVWFLVKGNNKRQMVEKLLKSDSDIPSGRVSVANQKLFWLIS